MRWQKVESKIFIEPVFLNIHIYIQWRKMPSIFRTVHWIIPETRTICIHKFFWFLNQKPLKNSFHRFKSELKLPNTGLWCQIRSLVLLYYYYNFNNKGYTLVTLQLKLSWYTLLSNQAFLPKHLFSGESWLNDGTENNSRQQVLKVSVFCLKRQ